MSRFDSLLMFCQEYSHIYCYGTGNMGIRTAMFLNKYGINIDGYIVTKKNRHNVLGIRVYEIGEIISKIDQNTGIILSLSEKYHDEVFSNFLQYGFSDAPMFFRVSWNDVTTKMILDLAEGATFFPIINNNGIINSFLENICDLEYKKGVYFENNYKEIRKKYHKIIFAQYCMRHIGEMCLTYYMWNIECKEQEDVLFVMTPSLWNNDYNNIPNTYFFRKIQEKIEIVTEDNYEFWRWVLQRHSGEIEFSTKYSWAEIKKRDMDYADLSVNCFQVELDFKEQEILGKMNVGNNFVCIYNRDDAYYKSMQMECDTNEYSYATEARNSSVVDYGLLGKEYKKKGIPLVRMGYQVAEDADMEGIIDYANNYRSEILDFYLISKCNFFVVSGSGIMMIAMLFSTPLVAVNSPVLSFGGDMVAPMSPKRDLIIMKKLWYQRQNRYLSLDEILYMEGKYRSYELFEAYRSLGIVFQSNLPEELLDIAEEMRGRLEGNYVYTDEDEKLQDKYWSILERNIKNSGNHYYNGRFGASFLRKNGWFLEDVPVELSIKSIL